MSNGNGFAAVFETARLYEWDAATAHLEGAGIPSFGQIRTMTGLVEAMIQPVPGPGVTFILLVPPGELDHAREVLRELDFSSEPELGIWQFNSSSSARVWWRRLAIFSLLMGLIIAAKELCDSLSR
jgi:hypothetical protein